MHDSYFQLIVSLFPQLSTKKVFMFQKKLTSIQHFQKKKKKRKTICYLWYLEKLIFQILFHALENWFE